jgi:glycerol kinase
MNISSTSSQNSIFGLANQPNTSRKPLVLSVDPVLSATEQEKLVNKQANQGIIADQQAIALFEKNQFEANAAKSSVGSSTFAAAADKDKPSPRNASAVASYQAVGNLAQRESVQQLFGVDFFA